MIAASRARPADFAADTRAACTAFCRSEFAAQLPRELVCEIVSLLRPVRAQHLAAGPHPRGDLWLEAACRRAVCRLGPSVVATRECVSAGQLVARLAFSGSAIFSLNACTAAAVAETTADAGQLWFGAGQCGVYSNGSGCALPKAELPDDEMPVDVVLDADARTFHVALADRCYSVPIPPQLRRQEPLCIAATLWAGGKLHILRKSQTSWSTTTGDDDDGDGDGTS